MSRPRSRSPLYSRIPTLQGRRAEGLFGNQMRSSVQSDTWRNPEYVKVETNPHWNKDSHQGEQNVDHWAKFIDAIEHAQQRGPSPMARYPMQADEDRPSDSPRRLPRERLPSPEHTHYGVEEHYRMASPGWNRNEAFDKDTNLQHSQREMRDRSYPRHQERRSHDRMDYEYRNEEHGDQYHERGSYSERSSKPDYREHHPSKGFADSGLQNEFADHHRGFSPRRAPLIVEHDHGIVKQDLRYREPPKMGGQSRARDPPRPSESQRNREPYRDRRDQGHHSRTLQERPGGRPNGNPREEGRKNYSSYERESQGRERSRHIDQSRMESHSRDLEGRREMNLRVTSDTDLRNWERDSVHEWEEERPQKNPGRMMEQEEVRPRDQYNRNPKTNVGPPSRTDFSEHETLKIKVDMSRPVTQASYLGYSSDRQLSLDLVNVGRQRLDFLPMLEHSGTYKESAVHCGTFAQEIITLVHQVKENYFSGQDIPLNERFANEQYYSIPDEIKEEEEYEDELEMENLRALMNRPQRMPSSGALDPLQRQQPVPDPGDLRYDLERRRQQKLEAVKITIAGANFTQMPSESQESEPPYMNDLLEEPDENFRWSEQEHEQQRQWDAPRQRMPEPTRQNIFNNDAPRQRMPAATRQNVFNNGSRQRKPEHPRQNFYPRGNRTGRQRGRRN
ncbi:uncharacterized protein LOC503771 isoform 1 [Danio rerio]|uniref:Uncharacterized protein LOC503771 isoform 1 n=3 Tax=Danio rerio TaxID=7955 RepID=A0AB13A9S4_DANRE|nr:uncharacterized protein CXorf23 homolog isoform X2 [Danio rerio]|eukprot:XP_009295664.1 uncharacterized protein CXorf23 homolog isoform X2 [Danio rerio]